MHLVQGSETSGSGESASLLQLRLRSTALLIFAGFAAFLVWHTARVTFDSWLNVVVYGAHFTTTMIIAAIAVLLAPRRRLATRHLRWIEWVTFGLPVAFFLLLQHERILTWSADYGLLPDLSPVWLLIILTYAIFIPNTWQRAAVVVAVIAAAPLVGLLSTAVMQERVRVLLAGDARVPVEMLLLLTLAAVSAVVGVRTINSLRDEALRARQLGQYKLKRLLGSGGMGEVYLAEHVLMKRPCAIKLIRPEKAGDPRVLARFEREVQSTARLSHWNTVDIFDYGRTEDGTFYYVMEYLPGMNLAELVRAGGPLPAARAIHLIRQACNALAEAHDLGLVHRDIKPANIFAAMRGGRHDVVKLLDFGLAKPVVNVDGAQLTQEGSITGSPLFMSPEQATGEHEPDARSDIYSIGAVLYYLIAGKPPFDDEKPMRVIIAHAHQPPQPPSQINPAVPDDLEMVVMRCLQKSPEDRYRSAAELVAALEDCDDYGRWTREDAAGWWQKQTAPQEQGVDEVAVG
jgi:serine/threonine-protein kinase